MVEKRIKSTLPIYGAGFAFIVFSLIFPVYKISGLIMGGAVSALVFILVSKFAPSKTVMVEAPLKAADTGDEHINGLITEGRLKLKEIDTLCYKISDINVLKDVEELKLYGGKIFNYLEEHPEKVSAVRQFMDYYLPTTLSLVQNYVNLKSHGASGENIGSALSKIEEALDVVVVAFKKQFDNLFEAKAIDIIADVNVMERLLKAGGLVGDDFTKEGR